MGRIGGGYARRRLGRPLAYVLTAGMLVSLALCAIFYLLLMSIHPPAAFGEPGAPSTIKDWVQAYSSWSQSSLSYNVDYRLSFGAALGFVVAFGVLSYPRASLIASFSLLNLYFAWTSHIIADISTVVANDVTKAIYTQDAFVWASLNLRLFTGDTYIVADMEALALLVVVIGSTLVLNLEKGKKNALLLSVRAAAVSVAILGVEIGLFDYREFFLQVTQVQLVLDIAPWFNNADLLLSGLAILGTSSLLLRSRRPETRG